MRGLSWTLAVAVVLPARAAAAENLLSSGYGDDHRLRNALRSTRLTARPAPRLHPAWCVGLDGAALVSPFRVG